MKSNWGNNYIYIVFSRFKEKFILQQEAELHIFFYSWRLTSPFCIFLFFDNLLENKSNLRKGLVQKTNAYQQSSVSLFKLPVTTVRRNDTSGQEVDGFWQ